MGNRYLTDIPGIAYYFDRRRYGNRTYTWIGAVRADKKELRALDPWPAVKPKQSEVITELFREANWQ